MAILKIARMGHPVLHGVAEKVDDPTDPEIAVLVEDMIDTLEDARGIGLAAPQVHVPKRVVIFFVPLGRGRVQDEGESDYDEEDESMEELTVMINPEIEPIDDAVEVDWEACLSVPDLMGAVSRHARIRYRWSDLHGESHERNASGFHARAVQHECDHLDGMLYPMRMPDLKFLGFAQETEQNLPMMRAGRQFAESKSEDDS